MLKGLLFFLLSLITHLYTTFVLTVLWNWFVVPALHVSDISFWLMYGLVLMLSLFRNPADQNFENERQWKRVMTAIDACIPEDRRDSVMEELKSQSSEIWINLGLVIFSSALGNTLSLGIGFIVHILASA